MNPYYKSSALCIDSVSGECLDALFTIALICNRETQPEDDVDIKR